MLHTQKYNLVKFAAQTKLQENTKGYSEYKDDLPVNRSASPKELLTPYYANTGGVDSAKERALEYRKKMTKEIPEKLTLANRYVGSLSDESMNTPIDFVPGRTFHGEGSSTRRFGNRTGYYNYPNTEDGVGVVHIPESKEWPGEAGSDPQTRLQNLNIAATEKRLHDNHKNKVSPKAMTGFQNAYRQAVPKSTPHMSEIDPTLIPQIKREAEQATGIPIKTEEDGSRAVEWYKNNGSNEELKDYLKNNPNSEGINEIVPATVQNAPTTPQTGIYG